MAKPQLTRQEIKNALWEKGLLKWKMEYAEYNDKIVRHEVQLEMYDIYQKAEPNSTIVMLLSRQTGKSFWLATVGAEQAISKPNSIVKLLTDTKVHVESIFLPIFNEIFNDCPEHLKPNYDKQKYVFTFPNGSQIQLAGSDNGHYERLRGQKTDLVLVDEAGFCDKLNYIVKSVLIPTTTHTGGKVILASTPPEDPNHEFVGFIEEAEMYNMLIRKTIFDNPLLSKEQIANIMHKMGGINSVQFRREYMCEIIRSEENVVFPEFDNELKSRIVTDWERPVFYDAYVGMDVGGKDLTAVLFLYYDFRNDRVVVEDEIVVKGNELKLPELANNIRKVEEELWTNKLTNEKIKPYKRVSDIDYIVINEIARETDYEIYFHITKKDNKMAAVNQLRVLIANEKIIIHPRCVNLIRHLDNCKWKKSSTVLTFERSPDDGHYDCVDALIYAVRAIQFNRNPYPAGYDLNLRKRDSHIQNPNDFYDKYGGTSTANVLKKIFNK